jgi:hypothetical protein
MPFVKALIPGVILTFVVCIILGTNGQTGAWLEVHRTSLASQDFYWSWPLFVLSTGIAWGIFAMME